MEHGIIEKVLAMPPAEFAARNANLSHQVHLLSIMPSPREVEENWGLFVAYRKRDGNEEVAKTLREALSDQPEAILSEFFCFWLMFQRCFLAVATFHGELTLEGELQGSSQ